MAWTRRQEDPRAPEQTPRSLQATCVRPAVVLLACGAVLHGLAGPARAADPVASDASYTVVPGSATGITLSATDGDSDPLSFIISSLPAKGTLTEGATTLGSSDLPYTIPANGKNVTFTAGSSAHGTDTFQFKANDGSADSNTATVSIVINQPPTQTDTAFFTEPNTDLKITLPAQDPDQDTLSYTITSLPGHGRLKSGSTTLTDDDVPFATSTADVTYSPDADYHGHDSFNFTATDGTDSTGTIAAQIEVNTTPVPDNLSITVQPGGTVTIELTSTDADKDPVRYLIVSLPDHGTLEVAGSTFTENDLPSLLSAGQATVVYRVEASYQGTDSFHYRVQDNVSVSDRAVVTIAVNTPPVSPGASLTTAKNTAVQGILAPTDADGDTPTVRISRLPATGTLKVSENTVSSTTATYNVSDSGLPFVYTPDTDVVGLDSFEWTANDGKEDSTPGEVTITILSELLPDDDPAPDSPTDGETTPDDANPPADQSTSDGSEEVLSEPAPPGNASVACGVLGAVETVITLTLMLLIAPARRFPAEFRHTMPTCIV